MYYICVVKTKALISFAVTAKLICAFVFANADCWFSHAAPVLCGFTNGVIYMVLQITHMYKRFAFLFLQLQEEINDIMQHSFKTYQNI